MSFEILFVFFIFSQFCSGYDKVCPYQQGKTDPDFAPDIKFFTNDLDSNLSKYACNLFTRFSNIQAIQISETDPEQYCKTVTEQMENSTANEVIILALATEEPHKPCSYRVHAESPVLVQLTHANRRILNIGEMEKFFEFLIDSRFGELRLGPLQFTRGGNDQTLPDKITLDMLIRSLRFGIHLGRQSKEVMLTGLYPPLKMMSDEKLDEEWAKYRDIEAAKDSINVSWVHAFGILAMIVYAAIIVFSMEPDHRAFVHAEKMPEGQSCHSESSDTSLEAKPNTVEVTKVNGKKAYVPLSQFLAQK